MEADFEQRMTPMRPDRDGSRQILRASSMTSRENFDEWRTRMLRRAGAHAHRPAFHFHETQEVSALRCDMWITSESIGVPDSGNAWPQTR
jgi:hypothetical protein